MGGRETGTTFDQDRHIFKIVRKKKLGPAADVDEILVSIAQYND